MINSPIDEIKTRLDVVEVIGSYIKLQKVGINYRAICPFHSEKKPSFFVSPQRQMWHCFGACGEGGDIFKFVMKIEGVEFGDALKILAQKAGVELKRQDPKLLSERQRLYEICELTARFFEKQLESKSGEEVKKYLAKRGISEQSIKKWRIGYSPDVWQGLSDFLVSDGYKREEIERAGLAIKSEKGLSAFYDRFRGRIIFPIFDLNSQVIGFTGRIFGQKAKEEVAKYVNTPNTLLYDKSRILYGLDKAKIAIRKENQCILVEGQTDVIMVSQAGFENVVATSGTALTDEQLRILKRYSNNLLLSFDMDIAGDAATKRGIDLAQTREFGIKVITMPEGKDPADIVFQNPQQWKKLVDKAKSIYEFYFDTAFLRFNPKTLDGKKEIARNLLPALKRIPNKIEQSFWVQRLAQKLEVKEKDIEEEMRKASASGGWRGQIPTQLAGSDPDSSGRNPKSRKEKIEERIISLILKSKQSIDLVEKNLLSFFSQQAQEILIRLKKGKKMNSEFFNELSLKSENEEIEKKEIIPEIKCCLLELRSLKIKNKLDQISQEIKKAEQEKNIKKTENLSQEFNLLSKELK
ncbi:DNA primase [Candidatus Parcubacteria bacterium]|nr:DNA primase [Candidatus Parcubacteria bacterium]